MRHGHKAFSSAVAQINFDLVWIALNWRLPETLTNESNLIVHTRALLSAAGTRLQYTMPNRLRLDWKYLTVATQVIK